MKLYKKENLSFIDGYLVDTENNILNTKELVSQVNEFTRLAECVDFAIENADVVRNSVDELIMVPKKHGTRIVIQAPETPETDELVKRVENLFDEADKVSNVDKANKLIADKFQSIVDFTSSDTIALDENTHCSDVFYVDPLELDAEFLVNAAMGFFEYEDVILKIKVEV